MERFPTPPSPRRAHVVQPTGSGSVPLTSVPLMSVPHQLPHPAGSHSGALGHGHANSKLLHQPRGLGTAFCWHPGTPLLLCPGTKQGHRRSSTSPIAIKSLGAGRRQGEYSWQQVGEGPWGKALLRVQLKGFQVSSPVSALPAPVHRWRKPHLSSFPQNRNSNKSKVGSRSLSPTAPRSPRSCPRPSPAPPHLPPTEKSEMA